MSQAKPGDTVRFHYTGTLTDGSVFSSSAGQDPLTVTLGEGAILPDLDAALTGMTAGDNATVEIEAAKAYGGHETDLVYEVPRDKFPPELQLQPGMQLEAATPDGQSLAITVVELSDETVTVDQNHPLAGKDLTFAVELVEIV
ncbi:MAG: peptidylprolyl isomerase [Rhodospirillales bacterium]